MVNDDNINLVGGLESPGSNPLQTCGGLSRLKFERFDRNGGLFRYPLALLTTLLAWTGTVPPWGSEVVWFWMGRHGQQRYVRLVQSWVSRCFTHLAHFFLGFVVHMPQCCSVYKVVPPSYVEVREVISSVN